MLPLFAYGTLRDAEFQRELFGREFAMRPACVQGYVVVVTAGGYLAAAARTDATVRGALVDLDASAYAIADGWEDLDVYQRIEIDACDADGRRERCCMYVQAGATGESVADERPANRSRAAVIADIRRFRAAAGISGSPDRR